MRVEVVDLIRVELRVLQRHAHRALGAFAVRRRLREVVRVARGAVAGDLGVDLRAALLRSLERLEDEDAGALAAEEAVTSLVEGAACLLRLFVAARERVHRLEAADADRRDRRFGAAGDHHLSATATNPFERLAERVCAARACARVAVARAAEPVRHRDLPGGEVRDDTRDRVGADLLRSLVDDRLLGLFERQQTAEADADEAAGFVTLFVRELELGVLDRHLSRATRELDETVHLLQLLLLDEAGTVPALDLGRDADPEGRRVKLGDGTCAARAGKKCFPGLGASDCNRSDEPDTRNDDAFHDQSSVLSFSGFSTVRRTRPRRRPRSVGEMPRARGRRLYFFACFSM